MAIEIKGVPNSLINPSGDNSPVKGVQGEPTAAQQATGKPSTSDTVTITDTAAKLNRLETALAQVPVVDTQRVESIQRALANGTYEVSSERIADKLLGMEKDLY